MFTVCAQMVCAQMILLSSASRALAFHCARDSEVDEGIFALLQTRMGHAHEIEALQAHHPTKEDACKTCASSNPDSTCYYGDCGDGSGQFCWSCQPVKGYTQCSASAMIQEAHHPTKEDACKTCASNNPDSTCYYGDCGDGSGEFCWSCQPVKGYTQCSASAMIQEVHHPTKGDACKTCASNNPDSTCYYGDCGDGSGEFCWSCQPMQGYTQCSASAMIQEAHHPTKEDACKTCASSNPDSTCYYGDCGDGSGKFCWSCQPVKGFTKCSSSAMIQQATVAMLDHQAAHHQTQADACKTCRSERPNASCYAGDCGDETNEFCWSWQPREGFVQCSA